MRQGKSMTRSAAAQAMSTLALAGLALAIPGLATRLEAQSPYGLAARQTIPWVIDQRQDQAAPPLWETEVNLHNPGRAPITVRITYLGAVQTATPGRVGCNAVTVAPRATAEFSVASVCPLNSGTNFGRLELSTLTPRGSEFPSDSIFLASARVMRPGEALFTVEGFPEGYLSGNRPTAVVTGLKSGQVNGTNWVVNCRVAALNDATTALVRLTDASGNVIGNTATVSLNPPAVVEMESLYDLFTVVGAPPGNYSNVTAHFWTFVPGGPGVFATCLDVDLTNCERVFQVAKYLDNNDEGRQHWTESSQSAFGTDYAVVSEVDEYLMADSNLHVAYFQHPDRVYCQLEYSSPHSTFDQIQMRLIDPDGNVVAGGPHQTVFNFDLGEKPQHHTGKNGRWLIEVAPDRTYLGDCSAGDLRFNCPGQAEMTPYKLVCSSGNGHDQLDLTGHCVMRCKKDNSKEAVCDFQSPPLFWCWL